MASTSNNPGISNAAATSKALTHELFFEYAYRNVIGEKQLRLLVNDMVTDNPGVQLPSARDVKQLLKFLDKDGNGTIDENEFTTWLADGANRSEQSKEKIRQTGNPTQVRFVNFLDAVLHWLQPSEDRIREIFDASNYEHDGHMSMEDLKELVEKTHQLPISNRLGELPSTEQDFKRLMELIDEDHSGTIERQEFMHWLKKGIALMRALDGKQRVQYALKDPFHIKLINMSTHTAHASVTHAVKKIVNQLYHINRKLLEKEKKKKHHNKNTTICIDCLPKSETKTVYLSAALLLAIVFLSLYLLVRRLYFGKIWKKRPTQSIDYAFLPATDSEREGSTRERGQSDSANSEMSYNSSIASHDISYYEYNNE